MPCVDDFWSALDESSATALAAGASRCSYTRGRVLVHEGQVPDRVFVLRSGCAKVMSTTPTGRDVVLAFRGPGSLVGEQSALDGAPRSATIVAIQPVEALVLSHRAFVTFLLEHPTAHLVVTQMLARLQESGLRRRGTARRFLRKHARSAMGVAASTVVTVRPVAGAWRLSATSESALHAPEQRVHVSSSPTA